MRVTVISHLFDRRTLSVYVRAGSHLNNLPELIQELGGTWDLSLHPFQTLAALHTSTISDLRLE